MRVLPESLQPPITHQEDGTERRVGVEIELTELDVVAIAQVVAHVFGGQFSLDTDYLARVDTEVGAFRVEADLALLQRIGRHRADDANGGGLVAASRDVIASVAETIAPYEVVAPPLPVRALPRLDELVAALRERGGQGTSAGVFQALGLQLNPDVPRATSESIRAHVRAYAVLEPWLRMRRGIDLSRRATTFIDPYPEPYVRLLLRQSTAPPLPELIDEYLELNPTRNRSLDMLPLFAHLDRARVVAVVDDPRIKSRPTFHYRLPDSRVDDPTWRVTDEWRHWLVVERVASRPALLDRLAVAYLDALDRSTWASADAGWAVQCEQILADAEYAAAA